MYQSSGRLECHYCVCSFKDKEVQRDAKMVSYKVVDKSAKPYVEVDVAGEKKVWPRPSWCCVCMPPLMLLIGLQPCSLGMRAYLGLRAAWQTPAICS